MTALRRTVMGTALAAVVVGGACADSTETAGPLSSTVTPPTAEGAPPGAPTSGVPAIEPDAEPSLDVAVLMEGLDHPWGVAFAPDGTAVVTERPGRLSARRPDGTVVEIAADLDDLFVRGETGLMGVAVDPDFDVNRRVYTCQGVDGPAVAVVAWQVSSDWTAATRVADPLVGGLPATSGRHGGCRMVIGPDDQLWIGTGDAAVGTHPQDLTSLGGKVLRVDPATGAGSAGNPFSGSADPDTARIYSYGHRNVQGLAQRPGSEEVWSVEHGPDRDDEVNVLVPGGNYGWDPAPGYDESVPMTDLAAFPDAVEAVWSSGRPTLATSGAGFLDGPQWGSWDGALAVGTLKNETVELFLVDDDGAIADRRTPAALDGTVGRIRVARQAPDGSLWVLTDNGGGDAVLRVVPS